MAEAMPVVLDDFSEDATKRSWDFHRDDNSPVDTIAELSLQLGFGAVDTAAMVATYPYPEAVPTALMVEAQGVLRS